MHSSIGATIAIGTVTALLAGFSAYGEMRAAPNEAGGTVVTDTSGVVRDSNASAGSIRWLTDANVLSLVALMNARQVSAADAELQGWHSDSVRAFAASIAREHAEIQHSADSVAALTKIVPVAPAFAATVSAQMQAQFDSIIGHRSASLDRAFVQQQLASEALVNDYLDQLTATAERPEIQTFVATAAARVSAERAHATALLLSFTKADSVAAADSAAARAARVTRAQRATRSTRAEKRNYQ